MYYYKILFYPGRHNEYSGPTKTVLCTAKTEEGFKKSIKLFCVIQSQGKKKTTTYLFSPCYASVIMEHLVTQCPEEKKKRPG